MRYPARDEITQTKMIICEGKADEAFVRALGAARNISGFTIRNCEDADCSRQGGINKFGETLEAVSTWKGFERLTDIVIVADNDMSPTNNFALVQRLIGQVNVLSLPKPVFGVPHSVGTKAAGTPAQITILMLPSEGVIGTLETLCLCAAQSVNTSIDSEVQSFVHKSGAIRWNSLHKIDKLMLRCMIGSQNERDPALGIGNVWRDAPHLIPLDHVIFDELEAHLRAI